jgi:signal transduction histidine kinase/tetratricopeptide (TPR) repeat protein
MHRCCFFCVSALLGLFCQSLPTQAQGTFDADSTEAIFSSLPDSLKIRAANELMKYYMDIDFRKSTHYAEAAFSLADVVDNKADVAMTYISWAIAQYNYGNFKEALDYNYKALDIFQRTGDSSKIATAYNNIGITHNALGDYSTAAYFSFKAFGIHTARQDWKRSAISCLNISSSYYEAKEYDSVILWARKGYRLYEASNKPEEFGYALQMYVDAFVAQSRIDSALHYLREVESLNKRYPNEYLATVNLSQRADVYALQKKYDSAILLQQQVIQFYNGMEMDDAVLSTRLAIARAYLGKKNNQEALRYANEVYLDTQKIPNKLLIVKSSLLIADILKAEGKYDRALQFAQKASAYKDSIMMQSLHGSIEGRFLDVKLEKEIQAKMNAITTLRKSNELISTQWLIIGLITLGLLVVGVIAFLVHRVGAYRKKLNDELTLNNRKLNDLNHEINGLVNTIVHDLKSPLNNVEGVLTLIEMSPANGDTLALVGVAKKALGNGHEIVRQLLELREVEENPSHLNLVEIEAALLLCDVQQSFAAAATQKGIDLVHSKNTVHFISDKVLLRRMIDNLVSNALKFSPKGSRVQISVEDVGPNVRITVTDEGPGFSNEDLQKIYGKFQKLSARPTAGESSNGLGLATVRLLVKRLRGTIELHTLPEHGATFTITLPKNG